MQKSEPTSSKITSVLTSTWIACCCWIFLCLFFFSRYSCVFFLFCFTSTIRMCCAFQFILHFVTIAGAVNGCLLSYIFLSRLFAVLRALHTTVTRWRHGQWTHSQHHFAPLYLICSFSLSAKSEQFMLFYSHSKFAVTFYIIHEFRRRRLGDGGNSNDSDDGQWMTKVQKKKKRNALRLFVYY